MRILGGGVETSMKKELIKTSRSPYTRDYIRHYWPVSERLRAPPLASGDLPQARSKAKVHVRGEEKAPLSRTRKEKQKGSSLGMSKKFKKEAAEEGGVFMFGRAYNQGASC
jgi:hypothetical protein